MKEIIKSFKIFINPFNFDIFRTYDFEKKLKELRDPDADRKALEGDWKKVCEDFEKTFKYFNP